MLCLEQYAAGLRESGVHRGLPVCGLVEDGRGDRWLITDLPVAEGTWAKAVQGRAIGIIGEGMVLDLPQIERLPRSQGMLMPVETLVVHTQAHPFVHLHVHTEFSALDGLTKVQEAVDAVKADGSEYLFVTDHGTCAAHLALNKTCKAEGIKPGFGIEAYFVDNAFEKDPEKRYDYWHLILLAKNDVGLRNLWRASTMANDPKRHYVHPRMDWAVLEECAEGLYVSTACLRGPLARLILDGDEEGARRTVARFQSIFDDRVLLELGTNHVHGMQKDKFVSQIELNKGLVSLSQSMSVPLTVVGDSHYACADDKEAHQVWVKAQTNKTLQDEAELFEGDEDYHLHTSEEVLHAIDYLGQDVALAAMAHTVEVAKSCDATIRKRGGTPVYHRHHVTGSELQGIELDNERMVKVCEEAWAERLIPEAQPGGPLYDVYKARFDEEVAMFVNKQFCGYQLIVWDFCLDPSTPVLTEDLRWVEIGKVEVGDRLIGFDEHGVVKKQKGHRYWHSAEVLDARRIVLPTYRVVLNDGTETITSGDHRWLVSSPAGSSIRWIRTEDLRVGQRPQRLVSEWGEPDSWEAGYIAGILDGEGYLSLAGNANGGHSLSLGFAQMAGPVLDTALRILDSWGFDYAIRSHGSSRNDLRSVRINGGRAEVMRLLGIARPQRLLPKFDAESLGRVVSIDQPTIVSIEPLGLGEVVALETTTGTLVAQGFAHHNCKYAHEHNVLMGAGRGSAAGSIVCNLMGITQIDPIEADLLFERYISPGRTELPDIDSDFPASKRFFMIDYLVERWGAEHVVRVGTVTRLRNKGVFKEVARVLKGSPDEVPFMVGEAISDIIGRAESGTAGLGLSWEELWDHVGDELAPYREAHPVLFHFAERLVGRLKSYGKHSAGVVIDPMFSIVDWLPLRQGEDEDHPVSEFPMKELDELGLVKFDILTVRTLDTVQEVMDLIEIDPKYSGKIPHPHKWREQFKDPLVWDMLCNGETLGVFQIETSDGTQFTKQFQPREIADLSAIGALVRPGPRRSGMSDSYLRRRSGMESVSYAHPLLEQVLDRTYGLMIYQEDIMKTVKVIAGYTSEEADEVRSILGKKRVDKIVEEGNRFRSRSKDMGIDEGVAAHMFEQMQEFAKYCVTGDTRAWLASSGPASDGTVAVEELYRRANPQLLLAVVGRTKSGEEYQGPCVTCGTASSVTWTRGQCGTCNSWFRKFYDPNRGVYGLTVHHDDRVRPARILAVHQNEVQRVWTVRLEDGKEITATADHRHLTPHGLRRVDELSVGQELIVDDGYEPHVYASNEYILGGGGFLSLQAWTAQAPDRCEQCGHDGSERRLERAHLDGDRSNNDWANLSMLCVSCHKRHDYRMNNRIGRWAKGHPANGKRIVEIEDAGEQMTYSVVMDDPHIWIANGIATSNSFNRSHSWSYAVDSFWCVHGQTRIYDWDEERYISVARAYHKGVSRIACYDEELGTTIPGRVKSVVRTGRKECFTVRLRSRKMLRCSADHQILTPDGYRRLADLRVGDLVAAERRVTEMSPERRHRIAESVRSSWATMSSDDRQQRMEKVNDQLSVDVRRRAAQQWWAGMDAVERQRRVSDLIRVGEESERGWFKRATGVSMKCGHRFASSYERGMCEWFNSHGIEHEAQVYVGGRPVDFLVQGVYIEFDGIGRPESYFDQKLGDLPRIVIHRDDDLDDVLQFCLETELMRSGAEVIFEPIVAIESDGQTLMYDIEMEGEPHNFLANGVVVHNCAWFKAHFPAHFLVACLSTADKDRFPDYVAEARLRGYRIDLPDVNESAETFVVSHDRLGVRYGLASIKGLGQSAAGAIIANRPYASWDDFVERRGGKCNWGHIKLMAEVGALDSLIPNGHNKLDLQKVTEQMATGKLEQCAHLLVNTTPSMGVDVCCGFPWDSEPVKLGVSGKPLKGKPIPKKCSKACRQYQASDAIEWDHHPPPSPREIRKLERERFGIYITSTPFDALRKVEGVATVATMTDVDKVYKIVAEVQATRVREDSYKRKYAFVTLTLVDGTFDAICFSSDWHTLSASVYPDAFGMFAVRKTNRGYNLLKFIPMRQD